MKIGKKAVKRLRRYRAEEVREYRPTGTMELVKVIHTCCELR